MTSSGELDTVVDNDVLIKAACYGLSEELVKGRRIGVLGAARYVVPKRILKMELAGDVTAARAAAELLLGGSAVLEPEDEELRLAAAIESAAQRRGVSLDVGESQLAAMTIMRGIPAFETGDKRAIHGFEVLQTDVGELAQLAGRLRCIEQIVKRCVERDDAKSLARAICAEPAVDKALSICFRCFSPPPEGCRLDPEGLESYIESLRAKANSVLER